MKKEELISRLEELPDGVTVKVDIPQLRAGDEGEFDISNINFDGVHIVIESDAIGEDDDIPF